MKAFFRIAFSILILSVLAYFFFTRCSQGDQKAINIQEANKEYIQDTSTILIPISIDIASFESTFDQQMHELGWFYEKTDLEVKKGINLSYRIRKDGRAQLYPAEGKIQLKLPMFIEIIPDIDLPLNIGITDDTVLKAKVTMHSAINADMDENWELISQADTKFEIIESPRIKIAGFTIDFDKQLTESLVVGQNTINKEIENQVQQIIDTREIIEIIWEQIKTPYEINADPFKAWVMIKPFKARASNLKPSAPGIMQTTFSIDAKMDINTGPRPIKVNTKRIPNAIKVKEHTEKYSQFKFPLYIPFSSITDFINTMDESISFTIPGNQTIELSEFTGKKKNEYLEVSANFITGSTSGQLTITGRPRINKEKQTIEFDIVDLKTNSNNKMIDQIVSSMQKSKKLRTSIEESLTYDLSQDLANLTYDITTELKNTKLHEYAKMEGYVNHIKIDDLYLQEDSFLLNTEIEASITCIVEAKK